MEPIEGHPRIVTELARLWTAEGGGRIPTTGRSMRPTFEDAAHVFMDSPGRIRFGDVLVYTNGEFLVVHRVVWVHRGRRYRTKGDGLPHLDREIVSSDHGLGRVVGIARDGVRYRTNAPGGRAYALVVALVSLTEGTLYRVAWRLDRLLTPRSHPESAQHGGRTTLRRALSRTGRATMALLDRGLFRLLHARMV